MKHSTHQSPVSPRSETLAFLQAFARAYTPAVAAVDRYYNAAWSNTDFRSRPTC